MKRAQNLGVAYYLAKPVKQPELLFAVASALDDHLEPQPMQPRASGQGMESPQGNIRVLLVTNSHQATLDLKDEVTGLSAYFDGIYTSHAFGYAKEQQEFWIALQEESDFDPATTMFIDDNPTVLRSAATFGVEKLVAITRPDTSEPLRDKTEFVDVEGVSNLL